MPATSKAQFRFMRGVAAGSIKAKGLSRAQAVEYTAGQSPQDLPERHLLNRSTRGSPPYTDQEIAQGYRGLR